MKKLLLITSIFCLTTSAFTQEETSLQKPERLKHHLGFGAGISTGYGLSYRYFGDKFGSQVNFSPYKDETRVNISAGITFLYRLGDIKEYSFYLYQGNHFYFDEHTETEYDYYSDTETSVVNKSQFFNHGIGVGVEYVTSDRISFNGMIGYGSQKDFKIISMSVEAAVYFKF